MKSTLEINGQPEKVQAILSALRKDQHLSKTFEGSAKDGLLTGFYTNLALINGLVLGYVKIKGLYDLTNGNLTVKVVPSNLFWVVVSFAILVISILTYKGITESKMYFVGSCLFAFIALGWTLAFILERRR